MAKVYLRSDGGREIVDLPPVCMKCGAPATARKSRQFSWVPPWIGALAIVPLAYIIVAAVLTKRQRVETTFCDQHKSYWWMFPLIMWMIVLGFLGLGGVAMVGAAGASAGKGNDALPGMVCIGTVVALIVVGIIAAIIGSTRIRPKEITDRYIHLDGVCAEFADAVEEQEDRQRRAFERDDYEPRRRRQRDEEDDPRYTR
jgi:hypothetical protein